MNTKGGFKMRKFKKALSVVLAVLMVSAMIPATVFAADTDPYLIRTAQELIEFSNRVNSGEGDLSAKLMNDIVLNENFEQDKFARSADGTVTYNGGAVPESFVQWEPIGSPYSTNYTGVFDGNGYTISGLYINSDSDQQALFGCVGTDGAVKNLGITNSFISAGNTVGGLIATNYYGTVENCYNEGDVYGGDTVGGIVAYGAGPLTASYNTGTISATSGRAGGIIGDNYGDVINCYNTGSVSGDYYIGGIAGANDSTISNCYNTGKISGNEQACGIAGANFITIENSYYLDGSATEADPSAISKTSAQFESGEVAFLLENGNSSETAGNVWGQKIGTDKLPVINGDKVYKNERYEGCIGNPGEIISYYSNEEKAIEYGEHNYSQGGICKDCNALKNGKDGFKSVSITLTDGVIINYYVLLSDEALKDSGAYIHFTSPYGLDKQIKLSSGIKDGERYKFSLELRPDQMADEITAQVVYSDGTKGNSIEYSVKKYADKVSDADASKALVDAMLTYGAFSQLYTGLNENNLVKDVTDYTENAVIGDEYTLKLSSNIPNLFVKSATLQLGADVTIKIKYQLPEGADVNNYTFKCDGSVLKAEKSGEYYYVYLRHITPQSLDKIHTFTVSDGENTTTLEYSAFSYMKNVLDNPESYNKSIVNLMNSMYDYNKEAKAYIG